MTWSPWHYTGQNFGLSMMFLRRGGVDVTPRDRQWLHVAFVASYVMLLAAFNEGASQDPLTLSAGLPVAVSRTIQIAAGLVFLAAGVMTFRSLAARGTSRVSLLPAITLYITQALWFVIPIVLTWISTAATPQTRYSTGILAVMHSAQYLWITHHFARKDAAGAAGAASTGAGQARGWNGWAYWTTLVAGGVALFIPGPWLASYAGRFDFTSSMLIVTAVVNIHHFILDGVVWKLRDPRVSKVLTSTPGARGRDRRRMPRVSSRCALGSTRVKVLVRAAAVILLIALAGVDQWRYVLALGGAEAERGALERASALNPFDSTVHLRLASAARLSGDEAAVERDLRRAVAVDSHSPAPYHALERFLIESGRWQDAYAHCQLLLERWPREVDTHRQRRRARAAVERSGSRRTMVAARARGRRLAASRAPVSRRTARRRRAYRRVAAALSALSRTGGARRERRSITRVAPVSAKRTALVVIKFGDALARTNQPELAASQYELAERIARQTGLAEIESLARERRHVC